MNLIETIGVHVVSQSVLPGRKFTGSKDLSRKTVAGS